LRQRYFVVVPCSQFIGQVVKDEGFVIDDSSVPFVYEVKAEISTPEEKLAGYLSADFANAGDEFAQHAMLTKLPGDPEEDSRCQGSGPHGCEDRL
jgi:hypothetical protein